MCPQVRSMGALNDQGADGSNDGDFVSYYDFNRDFYDSYHDFDNDYAHDEDGGYDRDDDGCYLHLHFLKLPFAELFGILHTY